MLRHHSCHCSFQLVSSEVATSISCRDTTLWLYRFQLVSSDLATSISYRDNSSRNCNLQLSTSFGVATPIPCRYITLCLCSFQLVALDVATSISCRDISSCPCSFLLVVPDVATSISCRDIILDQRKTCHSFKALLLSRPPSLVETSTFVATSRCCRYIIPLVSG